MNLRSLGRRTLRNEVSNFRLLSIDALRGAAALGVVLYHTVGPKGEHEPIIVKWIATPFLPIIRFGYVGVFLFFVVSGFCIHLSRARAKATGSASLGFASFWKRRIRRLYPPYLIALILFLLIAGFTSRFEATLFYVRDVLLHVLMLHNLDSRSVYSINGVFWTLAIEEQLYLAYFLLLYLRNRWGWGPTLTICLAARLAWFAAFSLVGAEFHVYVPISEAAASHWFTWALGAMSVEAMFGSIRLPGWCCKKRVGGLALIACVGLSYLLPTLKDPHYWLYNLVWLSLHPLWGFAFFVLLNWAVAAEKRWRTKLQIPVLIRTLAFVGVFSYSLYLTHELVALEEFRFAYFGLSPLLTAFLITTPASILFAWLFFRVAEKPYLNTPRLRTEVVPLVQEGVATADV